MRKYNESEPVDDPPSVILGLTEIATIERYFRLVQSRRILVALADCGRTWTQVSHRGTDSRRSCSVNTSSVLPLLRSLSTFEQ